MIWWLAMLICWVGTILCGLAVLQLQRAIAAIRSVTKLPIGEIKAACAANPNAFNRFVCVEGWIRSDNPLIADISGQPCVSYSTQVLEHYEDTGGTWRKLGKQWIANHAPTINFYLQDETDWVHVSPTNAEMHSLELVNRMQPYVKEPVTLGLLQFRSSSSPTRKVRQYQLQERVLPLNHAVTIIGEAHNSLGELMITAPSKSDRIFIITHRPLQEVLTQKMLRRNTAIYGLLLCLLLTGLMSTFVLPSFR